MTPPTPADSPAGPGGDAQPSTVEVTCTEQGDTAQITVVGELTDSARRPMVRVMTDLMLSGTPLHRVVVDVCAVTFINSAGIAALVQLQKMGQPRGIELTLAVQSTAVTRPLQLSGLWHRFPIIDRRHPDGGGS
ncbi:stage II sporulation protein AA (anti-sigma F factor antagonist) [Modestobacter sp. DSM 44400]|uniref:STAS domain-containing protein n=1 Tax=Modestobacter sp. DSM 44400 TaxID=1550230 RepID=UPI000897889E|nr:STAS domain-containing protein [Modestobacter sp. DSM 44400]SDY10577.1 stage II sporulation protein AA (anti-sigma F factor antagonist) [Modestobacter sp. DSM 44400]